MHDWNRMEEGFAESDVEGIAGERFDVFLEEMTRPRRVGDRRSDFFADTLGEA